MDKKTKLEELEELLESGDRQAILDCLMTYHFQTRDEAEMCEKLRNKEYELRMQMTEEKSILSEQWEKDAPLRMASVKYMSEHPLSHEEWMERKRRNEEIRRKNEEEESLKRQKYSRLTN